MCLLQIKELILDESDSVLIKGIYKRNFKQEIVSLNISYPQLNYLLQKTKSDTFELGFVISEAILLKLPIKRSIILTHAMHKDWIIPNCTWTIEEKEEQPNKSVWLKKILVAENDKK